MSWCASEDYLNLNDNHLQNSLGARGGLFTLENTCLILLKLWLGEFGHEIGGVNLSVLGKIHVLLHSLNSTLLRNE